MVAPAHKICNSQRFGHISQTQTIPLSMQDKGKKQIASLGYLIKSKNTGMIKPYLWFSELI